MLATLLFAITVPPLGADPGLRLTPLTPPDAPPQAEWCVVPRVAYVASHPPCVGTAAKARALAKAEFAKMATPEQVAAWDSFVKLTAPSSGRFAEWLVRARPGYDVQIFYRDNSQY